MLPSVRAYGYKQRLSSPYFEVDELFLCPETVFIFIHPIEHAIKAFFTLVHIWEESIPKPVPGSSSGLGECKMTSHFFTDQFLISIGIEVDYGFPVVCLITSAVPLA